MRSSPFRPSKLAFGICFLPGFVWYTVIVFCPIMLAAYYGFFDWPGGQLKTFTGLQNYVELVFDPVFWQSFGNNFYLVVACIIGQIGIAFVFSMLLNSRNILFKGIHRTVIFFPSVLSAVVIGFIWTMIYDYKYGLANMLLKAVGLAQYVQPWLNNTRIALFLTSIPLIWQYIGYYMIILLSAYASIDAQIFEMAEIDGANAFRKAVNITLPLLKDTLLVCIMLCISGNMKAFDHIYVMTAGGPGTATSVMALYAYKTSFMHYRMGYGSAMSVGILVLSMLLISLSRLMLQRKQSEGAI